MKAMNMPGFTAEAALYGTSRRNTYRTANRFGTGGAGMVEAQMPREGRVVCIGGGCFCSGDNACNRMFSEPGLCGPNAGCDEDGCWCTFA